MRILVIAASLALSACAGGAAPEAHSNADVPRDARGEPVFAAIAAPPAVPAATDIPVAPPVAVPVTGAPQVAAVASTPTQLPPRPKPVSCQHYKRCL